jgi:hypothetical protein
MCHYPGSYHKEGLPNNQADVGLRKFHWLYPEVELRDSKETLRKRF